MIRQNLLLCVVIMASLSPCWAQNTSEKRTGLTLSNKLPIEIESDSLDVKDGENTAQFLGNVRAVQGKMLLKAGKMTVFYMKKGAATEAASPAIDHLIVEDNVFAQSGTQTATSDLATIDMKTKTLVMTGKSVVLSDKGNIIKGCKLTVQMESGKAKFSDCRVKVTFDPQNMPKQ
jgi:lipopolysaccharide export system protein LptA